MITYEQIIVMLLRRLGDHEVTFSRTEVDDSFLPIKPIMVERDYEAGTLTVREYAPSSISDHDLENLIKKWAEE